MSWEKLYDWFANARADKVRDFIQLLFVSFLGELSGLDGI